jgi:hypothetical protein
MRSFFLLAKDFFLRLTGSILAKSEIQKNKMVECLATGKYP